MKDESCWVEVLEVIAECGIALAFLEIVFGFNENSVSIFKASLKGSYFHEEEDFI